MTSLGQQLIAEFSGVRDWNESVILSPLSYSVTLNVSPIEYLLESRVGAAVCPSSRFTGVSKK